MEEIWKPIPNFKDYEVSNYGRVRRWSNSRAVSQASPHYIKPWIGSRGHRVSLHKDNKKFDRMLRRLVAEAFIPNPQKYPLVFTVSSNCFDDRASNLMWGNQSVIQKFSKRKRL